MDKAGLHNNHSVCEMEQAYIQIQDLINSHWKGVY